MYRLFLIILIYSSNISSNELIFYNIEEYQINTKNLKYKIEAKTKEIDFDKLKKIKIFNIQKKISEASFYTNGKYINKSIEISFEKAYFYQGNFIMENTKTTFDKKILQAKTAIVYKDKILFKNLFMTEKNKKMRKIKYLINF